MKFLAVVLEGMGFGGVMIVAVYIGAIYVMVDDAASGTSPWLATAILSAGGVAIGSLGYNLGRRDSENTRHE